MLSDDGVTKSHDPPPGFPRIRVSDESGEPDKSEESEEPTFYYAQLGTKPWEYNFYPVKIVEDDDPYMDTITFKDIIPSGSGFERTMKVSRTDIVNEAKRRIYEKNAEIQAKKYR